MPDSSSGQRRILTNLWRGGTGPVLSKYGKIKEVDQAVIRCGWGHISIWIPIGRHCGGQPGFSERSQVQPVNYPIATGWGDVGNDVDKFEFQGRRILPKQASTAKHQVEPGEEVHTDYAVEKAPFR
jgi:hypothetical protein